MKPQELSALLDAATPEPWAWRNFGGDAVLVADHGRRDVILCGGKTRDNRGILVGFGEDIPNLALLPVLRNAAPHLLALWQACADEEHYRQLANYYDERDTEIPDWQQRHDDAIAAMDGANRRMEKALRALEAIKHG